MNITVKAGSVLHEDSDLGVLATFEDVALPDAVAGLLEPAGYRGRAGETLLLYSGGLSIKPAEAMDTMKSDMGGAAAVFGAMQVVAELKLPLHVVSLVSSAENMPSATAYRSGDVVTTLSGKTIYDAQGSTGVGVRLLTEFLRVYAR